MMPLFRTSVVSLFILGSMSVWCQARTEPPVFNADVLHHLRMEFESAAGNLNTVNNLITKIEVTYSIDRTTYNPVVLAYYGALQALRAKYARSPLAKLRYLSESLKILDEAVDRDPEGLEVRFVRFSTLHHLPPVFDIKEKRRIDIPIICEELSRKDYQEVDSQTQRKMIRFLLDSDRLNAEQGTLMRNLLKGS